MSKDVAFTAPAEPWTIYELEDGTRIKLRPILKSVSLSGKTNPATGLPVYDLQYDMVLAIVPTDEDQTRSRQYVEAANNAVAGNA